jgi:hypothetical protein
MQVPSPLLSENGHSWPDAPIRDRGFIAPAVLPTWHQVGKRMLTRSASMAYEVVLARDAVAIEEDAVVALAGTDGMIADLRQLGSPDAFAVRGRADGRAPLASCRWTR